MTQILIIIAFSLIVFLRTLRHKVIVDDVRWYSTHQKGMTPMKDYGWRIHRFICDRLYGGCTFLNIKISKDPKKCFDINVEIDHAFRIFLHTLICVLLYIATGSFLGSILYCCNSMNNQTSLWLNGRRYAINIILVLGSLIAWQHGLWYLSLPMWASTAGFHMTAIFAPILWGKWWILLGVIPFAWFNRARIMGQIVGRLSSIYSKELLIFFPRRIIVIIKSYGFYFFQMLFPTRTLMYYPNLHFWGINQKGNEDAYSYNKDFFKGILALLLSCFVVFFAPVGFRPMAIFAVISVLQWCNIVYAVAVLADRYSNMALPFFMVFLAMVISYIPHPYDLLVAGGFIGYYLMSLTITMKMYGIIWDMYSYHMYLCPESIPGRMFFANFYIKKQEFVNAWPIVQEGLKYHPNDFLLLYQAAQCWKGIGNRNEAHKYLMRAGENFYEGQAEVQQQALKDFIL